MRFEQVIILSCVVGFAFVGATTLIDYQWMASSLGFALQTKLRHSEFFAMYGGSQIGLSGFFFVSFKRPSWHVPALFVAAFILASMAIARLIGALMAGVPEPIGIVFFLFEAATTIGIVICLRLMAQRGIIENARPMASQSNS